MIRLFQMSKEIEIVKNNKDLVSKKGYYISPIDSTWRRETNYTADHEPVLFWSMVTPLLGFGGVLVAIQIPGAGLLGSIAAAGIGLIPGIVPAVFMSRHQRKYKKVAEKVNEEECAYISKWLEERYGISVSKETSRELVIFVTKYFYKKEDGYPIYDGKFIDNKGTKYSMKYIEGDPVEFYVEEAKEVKINEVPKISAIQSKDPRDKFTGQANVLYKKLVKQIQVASQLNLNVENQHFLSRIDADLQDVIELNKAALRINFSAGSPQKCTEILESLLKEVESILNESMKDIEKKLSTKKTYIESR